jgi:hypothetical protein
MLGRLSLAKKRDVQVDSLLSLSEHDHHVRTEDSATVLLAHKDGAEGSAVEIGSEVQNAKEIGSEVSSVVGYEVPSVEVGGEGSGVSGEGGRGRNCKGGRASKQAWPSRASMQGQHRRATQQAVSQPPPSPAAAAAAAGGGGGATSRKLRGCVGKVQATRARIAKGRRPGRRSREVAEAEDVEGRGRVEVRGRGGGGPK